nr:winged helix-turn-helix transcriptional regulator [Angustibacter aerolatus]
MPTSGAVDAVDALDVRLVDLLTAEPRVGVLEASRRLGVARGTVQARLDRLVERGVIAVRPVARPGGARLPGHRVRQPRDPPGRPRPRHRAPGRHPRGARGAHDHRPGRPALPAGGPRQRRPAARGRRPGGGRRHHPHLDRRGAHLRAAPARAPPRARGRAAGGR